MNNPLFTDLIPGASHWSLVVPAGHSLQFKDIEGGANLSLLFYNPKNLLERYNAPDTLKCQHTFKLTDGNCLFSDMGRIFCSIVRDDTHWIDSVGGLANKQKVTDKWGQRDYQKDRNNWLQNGYDSMLVEIAKYGLGKRDMAANVNLFSKVFTDDEGNLNFAENHSQAGDLIVLRFEIETLVVLSSCPHPMNPAEQYPSKPVEMSLLQSEPVDEQDSCFTHCAENARGLENDQRYLASSSCCGG